MKKHATENGEVKEEHPKTAEKHVTYLPSLRVLAGSKLHRQKESHSF